MKNNFNFELNLEHSETEQLKMRVLPDRSSVDLVGFTFSFKGQLKSLTDVEVSGEGEEYFHIDKFQTGLLIDYLKKIYDTMDDLEY